MTRAEAWKKIQRLLGKTARIRVDDRNGFTSPERRETARAEGHQLGVQVRELDERIKARRQELLGRDPLYQEMLTTQKALKDLHNQLTAEMLRYRFTAGRLSGVGGLKFFHVEAQGDTWEEVIATLQKGH